MSGGEEGKGGCVVATAVNSISPRDFFAAFALQGLVSYLGTHKISDQAADAYKLADAMMAERTKPPVIEPAKPGLEGSKEMKR